MAKHLVLHDANYEKFEKIAAQINSQWTKTVESILAVAKLFFEARTSLSEKLRPTLIKKLKFSGPTFRKLATIGENNGLYQPGVTDHLPPSFYTIYESACLHRPYES